MNTPKVQRDYLKRQIERLRAEGIGLKQIAHRFGYSYSRIRQLCCEFSKQNNSPVADSADLLDAHGSRPIPERNA